VNAATGERAFVIGAGVAGLSAAARLAARGRKVTVFEAAAQAGGRCRAYPDPVLEMTLDNGNHLVLSGNRAVADYLALIGASDRLTGPADARLAFHDVRSGQAWTIRPNGSAAPWWLLDPTRRVPKTQATDYLALAALLFAPPGARVGEVVKARGALWDRLLEPFLLAALNTEAAAGSANLAGAVIARSLARGGNAYRSRIATPNLSATFIDPALAFLAARGGEVRLQQPVRELKFEAGRLAAIVLADGAISVGAGESVVLAAPPWISTALVPGLMAPTEFNAIVNGHFRIAPPPGLPPIVGVIGGTAQWVFAFSDRLSTTVSAAGDMADQDREGLARALWADVAAVHQLPSEPPPWRIVKERRATFAATPEQDALRPPAHTAFANLVLAGDWTATGLPATLEGAIASGAKAAAMLTR
jgi:squalene-associated FAD-dependent desaturase